MLLAAVPIATLAEDLQQVLLSLQGIYPELVICATLVLVVLLDLFRLRNTRLLALLSTAGILAAAVLLYTREPLTQVADQGLFLDMLQPDGLSVFLRALFLLAGLLAIWLSERFVVGRQANRPSNPDGPNSPDNSGSPSMVGSLHNSGSPGMVGHPGNPGSLNMPASQVKPGSPGMADGEAKPDGSGMASRTSGLLLSQIGEYYSLILSLLLGAMLMSMTTNFLLIYLSIELVSISSYLLTNFSFSRHGSEAGMKYLLFGAVASAVMLFGMSLLYGFTGTLNFADPSFQLSLLSLDIAALPLMVAGFMTLAGFLFKLSAVPFHIWAPDVYQGAPLPVAALFSIVPKLAALALLIRFLFYFQESSIFFVSLHFDWQLLLALLAGLSMFIGNLAAVWQDNVKRMLAYSSIAHTGFLMAGVLTYSTFGIRSVLFYASIYLLMNFAAFLLVKMLSAYAAGAAYAAGNAGQSGLGVGEESMKAYSGLGRRLPYIGAALVLVMISLTGLPPTAGFTAKLLVFTALWEAYQQSGNVVLGYLLLAGVVNTVIALFYYLKIPYFMYFRSGIEEAEVREGTAERAGIKEGIKEGTREGTGVNVPKNVSLADKLLLALLVGLLLLFFFKADWLLNVINTIDFIF